MGYFCAISLFHNALNIPYNLQFIKFVLVIMYFSLKENKLNWKLC